MENKECCLLCDNEKLSKVDDIDSGLIISSYRQQLNINVESYFVSHKTITLYQCPQCGIRFFSPVITGADSFYEDLQKFEWYYQTSKSEYEYCSKFTENKSVLEIGCGGGFFWDYAKARLFQGLEFNQRAVKVCLQKGIHVEKIPISDFSKSHVDEYDIVCSFQVLEHVDDPFLFIQDAISCLKSKGLLLISVPSEDSFVGLARNNILNMPPHHLSRWPDVTFTNVAEQFQLILRDIHHEELDPIHYDWLASIIGQQIVKRWCFHSTEKLFDKTAGDIITSKIGTLFGRMLKNSFLQKAIMPNGHTVTAVFEKP